VKGSNIKPLYLIRNNGNQGGSEAKNGADAGEDILAEEYLADLLIQAESNDPSVAERKEAVTKLNKLLASEGKTYFLKQELKLLEDNIDNLP